MQAQNLRGWETLPFVARPLAFEQTRGHHARVTAPKKKMPQWAVLLIILGSCALVGVLGLIALGAIAYSKRDAIAKAAKEEFALADKFAATHSQEECVEESFRSLTTCVGIKCDIAAVLFINRCMSRARRSPEYCANVPAPHEVVSLTGYTLAECARRGYVLQRQTCTQLVQASSRGCHPIESRR